MSQKPIATRAQIEAVLNGESVRDVVERLLQLEGKDKPSDKTQTGDYLFNSKRECVKAGHHAKSCDDDGYCNRCGEQ